MHTCAGVATRALARWRYSPPQGRGRCKGSRGTAALPAGTDPTGRGAAEQGGRRQARHVVRAGHPGEQPAAGHSAPRGASPRQRRQHEVAAAVQRLAAAAAKTHARHTHRDREAAAERGRHVSQWATKARQWARGKGLERAHTAVQGADNMGSWRATAMATGIGTRAGHESGAWTRAGHEGGAWTRSKKPNSAGLPRPVPSRAPS